MLMLKRASASRTSGEWNDDNFDVLADGGVVGRIFQRRRLAGRNAVDVDARLWASRGPHSDARLRGDTRGRDGGVRQELAAGIGRVLINAQIAAGYAFTLRLRHTGDHR
jgi:hypothetical protein